MSSGRRIECIFLNAFRLVIRRIHSIKPIELRVEMLDESDDDVLEERISGIEEQLNELEGFDPEDIAAGENDELTERKDELQDMIDQLQDVLEELENSRNAEYEEWQMQSAQLQYQLNELQNRLDGLDQNQLKRKKRFVLHT